MAPSRSSKVKNPLMLRWEQYDLRTGTTYGQSQESWRVRGDQLGPYAVTITFAYWGEDLEWHFEIWSPEGRLLHFRNGSSPGTLSDGQNPAATSQVGLLRSNLQTSIEELLLTPMMRLTLDLTDTNVNNK